MFRIIFVLDILSGKVVHAVKGEREKYGPIDRFSSICVSSDPIEIIDELGPREVYIADLNRLMEKGNNDKIIKQVTEKTRTMLDLGASTMEDVHLGSQLADSVVLGTETTSRSLIDAACSAYPGSINVSIDIKGGRILTREQDFMIPPLQLIKELNGFDIKDLIVLDLSRVGTSSGFNTHFLDQAPELSDHNILLGGGIRGMEDVEHLEDIGLSGALVATSVHNGAIPLDMIR